MDSSPNPTPPSARRPQDPTELLDALVPVEPAERRRAFAALLRELTDERGYAAGEGR